MYRFIKKHRLLSKSDFDVVFSNATKIVNPEFTVLFCANTLGHPRLGFALSKKMIPRAYRRNHIKRILRESFRLMPALPAVDIVVLARPFAKKAPSGQVRANLDTLWRTLVAQYKP